jgi:DNA-binding PadR family transcriptional regulator
MPDVTRFLPLTPQQFHILLALSDRDRHGYGIILDVAERTEGSLRLGTGTLYTAVGRLSDLGLIAEADAPPARAQAPQEDDRRKYYRLLPLGRAVLRAETARLEGLVRHAHDRRVYGQRRSSVRVK